MRAFYGRLVRPLTVKTTGSTETDINWNTLWIEQNLVFSPLQAAALSWDRMLLGFFSRLSSAALLSLVPVPDVQYLMSQPSPARLGFKHSPFLPV